MTGPLEGVKVLDIGAYAVGPGATAYLGFLGAEVVRIEGPGGDGLMDVDPMMNGMGPSYINANLQKRNVALNLKDPEDLAVGKALVEWADVLVENRLPGVVDRLGLGFEDAARINPRLVYVSSPGFGSSGPYSKAPALDQYIQALSGFARIQGKEGTQGEIFRAIGHLDWNTSIAIVQAAILGLMSRRHSGRGQRIEVWHYSTSLFLQITRIAEFLADPGAEMPRGGASTMYAPSQAFTCLDNRCVNVTATSEETWRSLCKALDIEEKLLFDQRFASNRLRLQNRAALAAVIEDRTREAPAWWWIRHLRKHDVPCGPVYDLEDILRDPHIAEEQMVVRVDTPWGKLLHAGHPWKFSRTGLGPMEGTHEPGQDSDQIREMVRGLSRKGG